MSNNGPILKQLALSRMTDIGCEKLPPGVVNLVVSGFVQRAEQRLNRLVRREITVPKIAKLFTQGLGKEGVLEGERHAPPSNEMGSGHGAFGDMSQNP